MFEFEVGRRLYVTERGKTCLCTHLQWEEMRVDGLTWRQKNWNRVE